jgi:hypothetical protein
MSYNSSYVVKKQLLWLMTDYAAVIVTMRRAARRKPADKTRCQAYTHCYGRDVGEMAPSGTAELTPNSLDTKP